MTPVLHRLQRHGIAFSSVAVAVAGILLGIQASRSMPTALNVGTHHLRAITQGSGSPTVVLETFGPAPMEIWNRIRRDTARFSSVFAYDHAGYWGSEPGPKPRDAQRIASELHTALHAAWLPPPYLLVGYSFGGPYTRVFADRYPTEVAGMILIDPTQEAFMFWLRKHFPSINRVSGDDRSRQDEWGSQDESMQQAADSKPPNVPVTLISATSTPDVIARNFIPRLRKEHERWLAPIPGARHVLAAQCDHGIVLTHPEIVVEEIRLMVSELRRSPR